MADDSGWWARRLGNGPAAPPQNFQRPMGPGMAPQGPPPQFQQPAYAHPQAPNAPQYVQQAPQLTEENFFQMTQYWTGGEGVAKERVPCPQCGGGHYFSRSATVSRGPAPAPLCYDCGFNGMFVQGDMAVWSSTG